MKFWPESLKLKPNKEIYYLFGIFFALVVIKSVLTLPFQTPWIFADEVVYDNIAQNILEGTFFSDLQYCQTYPPGYSVFLSIAYLFSGDKTVIYHIMLIMNTILTSSIIFPSYFILKKYISEKQALLGSVLISVLPAVTLYNSVLMSENLFIPLTMFSIWFLHEALETNKLRWNFLAGISVFYLYFTRETGLVFCIALFVALAFFTLNTERGARLKVVKDKVVMLCSFAIPFLLWVIYKKHIAAQTSLYNTDSYITTLTGSFLDIDLFSTFSTLTLHEIEYLALSGYVTVFVISLIFIVGCIVKPNFSGFSDRIQQFCSDKILTLRSMIIYCLVFGAGLLVITVTHMQQAYVAGNQYYAIFGRYIDPIVPPLFLFGVIGLGYICSHRSNRTSTLCSEQKFSRFTLALGIGIFFIFAFTLPHTYYKFSNMFGIYYIPYLQDYLPFIVILIILALVFVLVPVLLLNRPYGYYSIIGLFIVVSIFLSIPTYNAELTLSDRDENTNQIQRYLQEHTSAGSKVGVDSRTFDQGWFPDGWFSTIFWSPAELSKIPLEKETIMENDYIISEGFLNYPCVNESVNGYKLYSINKKPYDTQSDAIFRSSAVQKISVGWEYLFIDGLHRLEYWDGIPAQWASNNTTTILYSNDDCIADLSFTTYSFHRPRTLEIYANGNLLQQTTVPTSFVNISIPIQLHMGENIIKLHVPGGAERPCDIPELDNRDTRELSVAVQNVTFVEAG
jgi:hypothetical protein